MASVDDIRLKEAYLEWDPEEEGTLLLRPEKRDWSRKNYQMDLRYIEYMVARSKHKAFTLKANLGCIRIWHLDWPFFNVLLDGLRKRIKNKFHKIIIIKSTLPVWFAHWCLSNHIPQKVKDKIEWG